MGELRGEVTAIGVFPPDPIERLAPREGAVNRVIAVAHGQEHPVAGDVAAEVFWQGGLPGLLWRAHALLLRDDAIEAASALSRDAAGSWSRGHRSRAVAGALGRKPEQVNEHDHVSLRGGQVSQGLSHDYPVDQRAGQVVTRGLGHAVERHQDHAGHAAKTRVADGDEQPARDRLRRPQCADAPHQRSQRFLSGVLPRPRASGDRAANRRAVGSRARNSPSIATGSPCYAPANHRLRPAPPTGPVARSDRFSTNSLLPVARL